MAIREDVVVSAAKFLRDPSVASTPIENKIAFLRARNLTQDEVNAALAQAGLDAPPAQAYAPQTASPPPPFAQPPQYYGQHPPQYPPYGWQQPPAQPVPRRDWRDWFIMATMVSGVSYGLYQLGKRYVYPLIAPPTPERLEQDKKSIDEQFERAFALVEQVAKDTEVLKAAERERTERLDSALSEVEVAIKGVLSANGRRDDEAALMRDDVQNLKDSIPRALDNQKELIDTRMREVNAELKSLKTLIAQRMNPTATSASISNYLRPAASSPSAPPGPATGPATNASADANEEPKPVFSPFGSGMQTRASIPSWQLATAASKSAEPSSSPAVDGADAGSEADEAAEGAGAEGAGAAAA